MIPQEHFDRIVRAAPIFRRADPQLAREFMQAASLVRIRAGSDVFVEGDQADNMALLLSGAVRVYKISESGREITLYRFGAGESCILTANAILSQQSFPAIATVEQDAEVVLISAATFRDWVRRYDLWRDFVFDMLSRRLANVIALVEEVAFRRMDARVAELLLRYGRTKQRIVITHQQIAAELGSSREVISRILEDFARRGLIQTGRGAIEILDEARLQGTAGL